MKTFTLLSAFGICLALTGSAFAQANSLFGNNRTTGGTGTGTAAGGATPGASQIGGATGGPQFGQPTTPTNQGGLAGRNDNAGRFIGQQNAGQQNNRVNRTFQAAQNNRNANVRNAGPDPFGAGGASGNTVTIRPVTRVAFRYPRRAQARIGSEIQTRFSRLAVRQPRFSGVKARLATNGTIILSGTVASEDAKVLAANVALLEPGVRKVTNRLVVR